MQLRVLHTLVIVAYHLVESGCKDEDLFGVIAVLLTLLVCGENPDLTAPISLDLLLGSGDQTKEEKDN